MFGLKESEIKISSVKEGYILRDSFARKIDYMRVSITDRCNFRCRYCMPQGIKTVPMSDILTYEEILEVVRAAVECGISKIKITGGEPLVRRGAVNLIRELKNFPDIEHITMTTNGVFLAPHAKELKEAGLEAVNISLDSLNRKIFCKITGFDKLNDVLKGIDAALSAGLRVKINSVLQEELNSGEWRELLELARNKPVDVRFIELMPIGEAKKFIAVNNQKLLEDIRKYYPLEPDKKIHGNGPAVYFKVPGFSGSIGFISALHGKFCSSCNRIRLTARGELKPCLCFSKSYDLRKILRDPDKKNLHEKLKQVICSAIEAKPQSHSFENESLITELHRMAEIGG